MWKPNKDFLLPGVRSRGFRPAAVLSYALDFLTNYEIGAKATLFGGKLRVSSAVYQQN